MHCVALSLQFQNVETISMCDVVETCITHVKLICSFVDVRTPTIATSFKCIAIAAVERNAAMRVILLSYLHNRYRSDLRVPGIGTEHNKVATFET